jgi:uncharacterized protein involved in outer membrane biogenesis
MSEKKRSVGRSVLYILGSLLSLVVIAALVLMLVRVPLNLSNYKSLIESSASNALGRAVKIEGDIKVTTSLWPYFEIQGLRILDAKEFGDGDLANMDLARITVGLLPLLQKKIHIREFRVESLELNFIRTESGAVNWEFDAAVGEKAPPPSDTEVVTTQISMANDSLAVDVLALGDISVTFRDEEAGEAFEFELYEATGSAEFGEPMMLSMKGELLNEPFTVDVEANSLGEFLAMTRSRLEVTAVLAGTRFHFAGLADTMSGSRSVEFDVAIEGERLDSLGAFLKLDLPPLEDYRVSASFQAEPGRLELTNVEVSVKESAITGNVVIDKTGAKPFASLKLTADTIQLTDFDTGDWSPDGSNDDDAPVDTDTEAAPARAELLSPDTLQRANAKIEIRVGEVLSGKDTLGSGEVVLELKDGRLALDALRLNTPKTSLLLAASVRPDVVASDASLRVLIENFDFGVLARLANPESDVGGSLNMDIDVTMTASGIRDLLSGANGYIDVAGHPENMQSGVVDLWAVNLLSSVVSSSVEDENASEINCIISRWSVEDGLMTARQIAIDTSRIRICGEGNIDFNERTFDLEVFPTAKKPEFFSLAAPLVVKGSFQDFDVGAKGGVVAVGTTAVRFAVSPVTTPFKRLVREDLPADGADICALPIGPHEGELEALPGC